MTVEPDAPGGARDGSEERPSRLTPDVVTTVYREVCNNHAAIADFRAKLLALLPLASGTGVFILLEKFDGANQDFLAPIGLFGVVVTLGLFMYELRGIQDCVTLRRRAEAMERWLRLNYKLGLFDRGRGAGGLADEVGAGWIVYTAVLISWSYVAGTGFGWSDTHGRWPWPWLLAIVYLVVLVLALPCGMARRLAGLKEPCLNEMDLEYDDRLCRLSPPTEVTTASSSSPSS